jgi:seryl-tRNA synthetase
MLDIKFIRENPKLVEAGAAAKNIKIDVSAVLKLDEEKRDLQTKSEEIRAEQKQLSAKIPKADKAEKEKLLAKTSRLKQEFLTMEEKLNKLDAELTLELMKIPNMPTPDVKIGKDESGNEVRSVFGDKPKFGFEPKDALTLGEDLDIIDTERAAKVSGSRFGYLKGKAALLEFALVRYVLDILTKEGFTPIVPPVMVGERAMRAMGYLDRAADEVYSFPADNLYLVGTSEQSVGPMHMDEVFEAGEMPKRYVAFSTCFRREAGSYGKDTRGIIRLHQFDKLEMLSFVLPEKGDAEHLFLLAMEEKLMQGLGLHYHVLNICSGDLGDPAARKYDIETWVPSENKFRETHSTSTTTDWQARRLNIRYKRPAADKTEHGFVHMLNGTAFAIGRILVAIIENNQQADGSIKIPDVLVPYCGFDRITKKDS